MLYTRVGGSCHNPPLGGHHCNAVGATVEGKVAPRKPLLSASDVFEKLTGSDGDGAARMALGPLTTQHGTKSIPDVHMVNVENACGAHRHCAGVRLRCSLAS